VTKEIVLQVSLINLDVEHVEETLGPIEGKDRQQGLSHVELGLKQLATSLVRTNQSVHALLVFQDDDVLILEEEVKGNIQRATGQGQSKVVDREVGVLQVLYRQPEFAGHDEDFDSFFDLEKLLVSLQKLDYVVMVEENLGLIVELVLRLVFVTILRAC